MRRYARAAARVVGTASSVLVVACWDHGGTGPIGSPYGTLRFVAGTAQTDTVTAEPVQALVVEVRDSTGAPATGAVVRFQALYPDTARPFTPGMFVVPLAGTYYATFAADTVDTRGRAAVLVEFGTIAGPAGIQVTVPEFGLQDTATYNVLPGRATGIRVLPKDTALYVGGAFQAHGATADRWGNSRTDPSGVKPPTLVSLNLDGSAYQQITPTNVGFVGIGWTPAATALVFPMSDGTGALRLQTVDLGGSVRRLLASPPVGLQSEAWPQYSSDGTLYFSGVFNGANYSLWKAATDGSNAQQLYVDSSGVAWRGSPSPDGTRLAFVNASAFPSRIQVYTIASGTVSSWGVSGQVPRWAPNAELIAFVPSYGGPLFMIRSDGTDARQVSPPGRTYLEDTFSWSTDGAWLAARGAQVIELIRVETGEVLPLSFTANLVQPLWKP